jgi:hypothetical protein
MFGELKGFVQHHTAKEDPILDSKKMGVFQIETLSCSVLHVRLEEAKALF